MVFSVSVVTFLMTLAIKYCHLSSLLGCDETLPWMIEVWINIHLASDDICNIVNLWRSNFVVGRFTCSVSDTTWAVCNLGSLHTQHWEPVITTLQALSFMEKKRSQSKFASHYTWGTNGVCECKMDVKSTWIPTWHRMDHVSCSLGLFLKPTSWR